MYIYSTPGIRFLFHQVILPRGRSSFNSKVEGPSKYILHTYIHTLLTYLIYTKKGRPREREGFEVPF